jgi:hypothetical protein
MTAGRPDRRTGLQGASCALMRSERAQRRDSDRALRVGATSEAIARDRREFRAEHEPAPGRAQMLTAGRKFGRLRAALLDSAESDRSLLRPGRNGRETCVFVGAALSGRTARVAQVVRKEQRQAGWNVVASWLLCEPSRRAEARNRVGACGRNQKRSEFARWSSCSKHGRLGAYARS